MPLSSTKKKGGKQQEQQTNKHTNTGKLVLNWLKIVTQHKQMRQMLAKDILI